MAVAAAASDVHLPPDACLAAPYDNAVTADQSVIGALVSGLRDHAEAFPSLTGALDRHQPLICIDGRSLGARGYFDVETNLIALKAGLGEGQMLAILIHELRHLDQVGRGVCPSDDIAMKEFADAVFAIEADASAVTAHLGYEMARAGDTRVQVALEGFDRYGDIAQAYARERTLSGSIPRALGAAFGQWYASDWRIERYYVASCSDYLDRVDESHRLPSHDLLSDDFYTRLCVLPDGAAYPCDPPDTRPR